MSVNSGKPWSGKPNERRRRLLEFAHSSNIWKSKVLSIKNKIVIFNTNVKAVLLHGAETSKTKMTTTNRIQTVVNSRLRRILGVWGA